MQTSTRRGIQYPNVDRSDKPDIPLHFKNLIDALELDLSIGQGTFASRPANPGYARYGYWGTDTHLLYYWDGSNWYTIGTTDVISPTLVDAKGDLIVGLSDNTPGRLAIGSNGFTLQADNVQAQGMKWARDAVLDIIAAKGDLLLGTAVDTLGRVAVGPDGHVLISDAAQAAGVKWGRPILEVLTSDLSADVTLTNANQFYDGPSISLTAGTWAVFAAVTFARGANGAGFTTKLWDGTTVYGTASGDKSSGGSGQGTTVPILRVVTVSSTTSVKISGAADATTCSIKAAAIANGSGNNATYIIGIRLA